MASPSRPWVSFWPTTRPPHSTPFGPIIGPADSLCSAAPSSRQLAIFIFRRIFRHHAVLPAQVPIYWRRCDPGSKDSSTCFVGSFPAPNPIGNAAMPREATRVWARTAYLLSSRLKS